MTVRPSRRNEALRETWFTAANELLAAEGYGALKLAPLCKRVGVTTGSFYHSFDSWQDFTDSLLEAWLRERTQHTVEVVSGTADPVERLLLLADAGSQLLHRTEAAIRVWSGVDERVALIQRQVDEKRYEVVHAAFLEIVDPALAARYATWALSTLVGFEVLADRHDRDELLWSLHQVLAAAQSVR